MKSAPILTCIAISIQIAAFASADTFQNPRTKWAFQADGPIRGSATVSDGQVFFGSSDGFAYAVNDSDGGLVWKFDTGGAIAGAPAVSDSSVVVSGRGREVFCLDRISGKPKWAFEMQADIPADNEWDYYTASPALIGDVVLVGSGDGHLYALQLASGELAWKFKTGDSIRGEPLVVGSTVYQPSGDDFVYALSLVDGSLQWKFETEGASLDRSLGFIRSDIFTKPSLQDDLLVFGSRDSKVYAVDIGTHEAKWTFNYDMTWAMSTVVDEDAVYVGWSTNRMLCALDLATGEKKWEYQAGAHTYTDGLLWGDSVIWGSADGNVYAFDRKTGEKQWSYSVGTEVFSSLVHDGECLYFGADDGRLRALTNASVPSRKAVYLPEGIPGNASGFIVDGAIAPYLTEKGYELLDSSQELTDFLSKRTEDLAPSVVVFAYAQVPASALSEDPSSGPLRKYLEAGGKVVWLGGTAYLHCFNEEGNFTGQDQSYATRLLDMEFIPFEDSGNYFSRPTQSGRNLGFPAWLRTSYSSLASESEVTVLAINEYGDIGAWLKEFHPRHGSGWVAFCTSGYGVPMREDELELIDKAASYALD